MRHGGEVEAQVRLLVDLAAAVDVGATVGERRHHLGVAQRQERPLEQEGPAPTARASATSSRGVRRPQLAVDREVVVEQAAARGAGPGSRRGSRSRPSSGRRRRAGSGRAPGGLRSKRSTKATDAALPASSSATTRSVLASARSHGTPKSAMRSPLVPPGSGVPGKRQAPGAHVVGDRRGADPVHDEARAALRDVVLRRDERQRGRRRAAPAGAAPSITGAGASSQVRARSATTRSVASPSCSSVSAWCPTSARSSSSSTRSPMKPQGGRGRCSRRATTHTRPFCSTSRRRPASPRPEATARAATAVRGPIAFASVRISTEAGGPVRNVATARPASDGQERQQEQSFE